jgi:hypothetical protein
MGTRIRLCCAILTLGLVVILTAARFSSSAEAGHSEGGRRTIVFEGTAAEVAAPPFEARDLWVTTADLGRATGFVIKPQGVCREELCFPLPKNRKGEFVTSKGSVTWFNLTAFAGLIKQPLAYDAANSVWVFGRRADVQANLLNTLEAPDFKLPDMNGKTHSLSEYRGKKVLPVTWASW